ncbi:alpha/beta hydrolase [Neptunicoccus sediminis]|uniref:alpha/beta hydrolase n=1 Tax=Neptunicoccus sediminis TaxID=1892596 RepID=UPI000845BFD6|nr:alpha/beta hydrolase [Neptunicoccus sediminis]
MIDWNDAFANGAYIDDAARYLEQWPKSAAAFRATRNGATLDRAYGPEPRNLFDLFHPDGPSKGTVIFVHGGYWHQLDKNYWSHLAAGPLAQGWSVAFPGYTLAPQARISKITQEIAAAVTAIAAITTGPLRLTGHSAGGHLVSRMNCTNSGLSPAVQSRIAHTISISGLHDLRPLVETDMNDTLKLDKSEAESESPALLDARSDCSITFWVGAAERPEFLRQNRLIAEKWSRAGIKATDVYAPDQHHFSVIAPLSEPDSPLTRALLG